MSTSRDLESLFHACLEAGKERRRAILADLRMSDPELCDRLEDLLAADADCGTLSPLIQTAMAGTLVGCDGHSPSVIGHYRILDCIGAGGMGVVYRAQQSAPVSREVAVKIVRPDRATPEHLARFTAERQAMAMMNHACIPKVLDGGEHEDGRPYFVMEYAKGEAITRFCDRLDLGLRERLGLFITICDAVRHAHQKGIVHRDLSPANILAVGSADNPQVMVIDFGLVKGLETPLTEQATGAGLSPFIGTLGYAAPEQVMQTSPTDTRADIYSLGAILYQLLTGTPPLVFGNRHDGGLEALVQQVSRHDVKAPSVRIRTLREAADTVAHRRGVPRGVDLVRQLDGDLDSIVMQAIEFDPERRYPTVAQLRDDVENVLAHRPVNARTQTLFYVLGRFTRRHRLAVTMSGVMLAILIGFSIVSASLWQGSQARLREFSLLGLAPGLDSLLQQELEQPISPYGSKDGSHIEAMQSWLDDVGTIVDLRPEVEEFLRSGREEVAGVAWRDWRSGGPARRQLRKRVTELVEKIALVRGAYGPIAQVKRRLEWARRIAPRGAEDSRWDDVRAAVKEDSRFEDLVLPAQPGLVPIGADPVTRLQEFALQVPDGELPKRGNDGRIQVTASTYPVFVLVPGGAFKPGSQNDDEHGPRFDPLRRPEDVHYDGVAVQVEPLFVSKYELTWGQWRCLTEQDETGQLSAETEVDIDLRHPVMNQPGESLTWVVRAWGMRLPSGVEWEYFARAGSDAPWAVAESSAGLRGRANLYDQAAERHPNVTSDTSPVGWNDGYPMTAPVDALAANGFGLHGIPGNVHEICAVGPTGEQEIRGGSWHQALTCARVTFRLEWLGIGTRTVGVRPVIPIRN